MSILKQAVITILFITFSVTASFSQNKKTNVLFIGNSYTGSNNLSQLFSDVSASAGDTIIGSAFSPGGQTLMNHAEPSSPSRNEIASGKYDYVVLQEQSQLPSFPDADVMTYFYPAVRTLDSCIKAANPCGKTVMYMTWGRKNGDEMNCATWPPVCTYKGMDSMLHLRYMNVARTNKTMVSPVGNVWKYLRTNYPNLDLYEPDGSHPNINGSYTAACCFYSTIFRRSAHNIKFNSSLDTNIARIIKTAVDSVLFDENKDWQLNVYDAKAEFESNSSNGNSFQFKLKSDNQQNVLWDFGDGDTSHSKAPSHTFTKPGKFTVKCIADNGCHQDSSSSEITVGSLGLINPDNYGFGITPNPANTYISIETNLAIGEYKIFNNLGQEQSFQNPDSNSVIQIDIRHLNDGIYTIMIIDTEGNTYVNRFLKQ